MDRISIIVPCYNESEALPLFMKEMYRVMDTMKENDFEIILVNDGSKDNTKEVMLDLAKRDERVKYILFSRNFGKEAAIFAGLQHATGDYVAMMDADLQDPPSLLPEMYRAVTEEGYDSVATRRVTRKGEPPIRSFFARRFYALMHRLSQDRYDLLLVNIVADVIIGLSPILPDFMGEHTLLICSGILDSRLDDVTAALEKAGLTVTEIRAKEEWRCVLAKREGGIS